MSLPTPYYDDGGITIYHGDCLEALRSLPEQSVQCCVTSPPYWGLREYGVDGQIGLEETVDEHVDRLLQVFREVHRVLRDDGTLWLNYGDVYAGSWGAQGRGDKRTEMEIAGSLTPSGRSVLHDRQIAAHPKRRQTGSTVRTGGCKPKDLIGLPWQIAFALRADGWYLRSDIIWHKPNPMPESVTDRPTKSHEYIFLLTKSEKYSYDAEAIAEPLQSAPQKRDRSAEGYAVALGDGRDRFSPGVRVYGNNGTRNKRSVWTVATQPYADAHFATFPPKLIEPCILAGSQAGDVVLDPFHGAGTTGFVAKNLGRRYLGTELNEAYIKMSLNRVQQGVLAL